MKTLNQAHGPHRPEGAVLFRGSCPLPETGESSQCSTAEALQVCCLSMCFIKWDEGPEPSGLLSYAQGRKAGTRRVTHHTLEAVSGTVNRPGNRAPPGCPHFLVSLPTGEGPPGSPAGALLTVSVCQGYPRDRPRHPLPPQGHYTLGSGSSQHAVSLWR